MNFREVCSNSELRVASTISVPGSARMQMQQDLARLCLEISPVSVATCGYATERREFDSNSN